MFPSCHLWLVLSVIAPQPALSTTDVGHIGHPGFVGELSSLLERMMNLLLGAIPERPTGMAYAPDKFTYFATIESENIFGPADWNRVNCTHLDNCPGWPTNWENFNPFIPYEKRVNMCRDCSHSKLGICQRHRQSPINLERNVTGSRQCHDRHRMNFVKGNCRFGDVRFDIMPHVLRAYHPSKCGVQPNIDYSMGFPRPWILEFTDVSVPSQHTIEGKRFDAELVLSHTYAANKEDRLIGNVSILLEKGTRHDHYAFLDLYIRGWRRVARKVRQSCRMRNFTEGVSAIDVEDFVSTMARLPRAVSKHIPTQIISRSYFHGEYHPYDPYVRAETEYYFRYEGSMPEPPCFEGVHWRVVKNPVKISPKQLNQLQMLISRRLNPRTCQRETAGRPFHIGSKRVKVNRPLQTNSRGHKLVYCECQDWKSAIQKDRDFCDSASMEERGILPYVDPALAKMSDTPSSTPSTSTPTEYNMISVTP